MADPVSGSVGLGGVASAFGRLSKAIEFWKEYKGRKVVIISSALTDKGLHKYMIVGVIEDVVSYPPAFKLSDVEEYIYYRHYHDETPAVPTVRSDEKELKIRSIEEKFVALSSAEQVEFLNENGENQAEE